MTKKNGYQFGIFAEKIALILLCIKGYKILKWRYRSYFGEIDIIAKKSRVIVFVEVKARRTFVNVEETLRKKQLERIKKSAEIFIAKNPKFHDYCWRFDFIEVGKFLFPKHHKNFW